MSSSQEYNVPIEPDPKATPGEVLNEGICLYPPCDRYYEEENGMHLCHPHAQGMNFFAFALQVLLVPGTQVTVASFLTAIASIPMVQQSGLLGPTGEPIDR